MAGLGRLLAAKVAVLLTSAREIRVCPERIEALELRQMRGETAADPERLDCSGKAGAIVGFEKNAAQSALAFGDVRPLAGHLGDKAADRRLLLQTDDRIVIAAHSGIGLVGSASRQDLP